MIDSNNLDSSAPKPGKQAIAPLVAAGLFSLGTAAIGAGVSGVQSMNARKRSTEANRFLPGSEDPESRNLLNMIRRKARAIETGTDPITSTGKRIIAKNLATTQGNLVRSSGGGDSRKLIEGFKASSKVAGESISKLAASTYPASQYYTQLGTDILGKISSRKFDLLMSQRAQKLRESAELQSSANKNMAGAVGFAEGAIGNILSMTAGAYSGSKKGISQK